MNAYPEVHFIFFSAYFYTYLPIESEIFIKKLYLQNGWFNNSAILSRFCILIFKR